MKKISTQLFLLVFSLIAFASCKKDIKAPVNKVQTTTRATQNFTGTQTNTQPPSHTTCPHAGSGNTSGSSSNNGG